MFSVIRATLYHRHLLHNTLIDLGCDLVFDKGSATCCFQLHLSKLYFTNQAGWIVLQITGKHSLRSMTCPQNHELAKPRACHS